MDNLDRFVEAQKKEYKLAYCEISMGQKMNHWMCYIFPQLKGLGQSEMSNYYGIKDLDEAKEYLNNKYLKDNLYKITKELLKQKGDINHIMGSVDALKLKSSMTLFYLISKDELFKKVIDKFYNGEFDYKKNAKRKISLKYRK